MNEEDKYTIENLKGIRMTPEEKAKVWDGVLRRVTDYPPGEYPFEEKPNTWDGTLKRKTDFPDGVYPPHIASKLLERDESQVEEDL